MIMKILHIKICELYLNHDYQEIHNLKNVYVRKEKRLAISWPEQLSMTVEYTQGKVEYTQEDKDTLNIREEINEREN